MLESKKEYRSEVKRRIAGMSAMQRTTASAAIVDTIVASDSWKEAHTVLLFHPMPTEPDITPLLATTGKQLFLPRMLNDTQLEIMPYRGDSTLSQGNYGILEPESKGAVPVTTIDLVVVPAVAMDRKGHRMGHGKGYYDRLLAGYEGETIAAIFATQLFDTIPHEMHDIVLHRIITENEIITI